MYFFWNVSLLSIYSGWKKNHPTFIGQWWCSRERSLVCPCVKKKKIVLHIDYSILSTQCQTFLFSMYSIFSLQDLESMCGFRKKLSPSFTQNNKKKLSPTLNEFGFLRPNQTNFCAINLKAHFKTIYVV